MGVLDYKFKLNFKNIEDLGTKEITEPIKFDGASFVLEQDKERFGRDIFFLNENIDLFFYNGVYDYTENPQQLADGTIINNLTQGFEYILEAKKQKGYEVECEFILLDNDIEFAFGVLDFQTSETDEHSYFKCKVLQSTEKQLIKRRADYVVDVFSDETPDEEYIEPLTTQNILLKAKPTVQISDWIVASNTSFFQTTSPFVNPWVIMSNPFNGVTSGNIQDTIAPFTTSSYYTQGIGDPIPTEGNEAIYNYGYIDAQTDLTNITLDSSISLSYYIPIGESISNGWTSPSSVNRFQLRIYSQDTGNIGAENTFLQDINIDMGTPEYIGIENIDSFNFGFTGNGQRFDYNFDIDLDLPQISNGKRLILFFVHNRNFTGINYYNGSMNIKSISTAIDTVIKGVRWIDLIKQNVKSISGLDVYAPKLDVGGKHYNNFAFTGNLIKGRDDVAFPTEFKDLMEGIMEVNLDYQVLDGKVYINHYEDFYPNKELLALPMYPNDDFTSGFNERFALNLGEFEYSTYETDKDENNTSDSVHTQTQWTLQNKQVENTKKVKLPQIRDYNKIEVSKREAVKTTTVTNDDDKLYLIDVVSLAPSSRGGFTASMTHNINNEGKVQLLKSSDSPSWGVLGFGVGSPFTIVSGANVGTYEVFEITDTIITLTPISPTTQSFTGVALTKVDYPFDNVLYTNRTNEGFSSVTGIISTDKSSNLRYTPKRNLLEWETYLASAVLYTNNNLKNSYYKVNQYTEDGLVTRLTTETEVLSEKANLTLNNPLLSAKEYNLTLVTSFDEMVSLLNALNTINEDDTIGGFIRCYNPDYKVIKGFIKKLDYEPATEKLTVTLEELYESDIIAITSDGSDLTINNTIYDNVTNGYSWFEFNGDYFIIFDTNKAPIINPTKYDKISFNGVIYNSAEELNQVLVNV